MWSFLFHDSNNNSHMFLPLPLLCIVLFTMSSLTAGWNKQHILYICRRMERAWGWGGGGGGTRNFFGVRQRWKCSANILTNEHVYIHVWILHHMHTISRRFNSRWHRKSCTWYIAPMPDILNQFEKVCVKTRWMRSRRYQKQREYPRKRNNFRTKVDKLFRNFFLCSFIVMLFFCLWASASFLCMCAAAETTLLSRHSFFFRFDVHAATSEIPYAFNVIKVIFLSLTRKFTWFVSFSIFPYLFRSVPAWSAVMKCSFPTLIWLLSMIIVWSIGILVIKLSRFVQWFYHMWRFHFRR